jgi:ABC-2 type transport system ATP-binding protein
MRQRVGIAQALINNPDLVVLDEPTDGVDPVGRRDIREIVARLKERGTTVFINSHLLSELEMVCDRVAILVKGTVASQGTIDELTRDQKYIEIEIEREGRAPAAQPNQLLSRFLPNLRPALHAPPSLAPPTPPGTLAQTPPAEFSLATGQRVTASDRVIRVFSDDSPLIQPIIDALRAQGIVIRAVRPIRPSLEDLFMAAVTDPTTGKAMTPGAKTEAESGRGGTL